MSSNAKLARASLGSCQISGQSHGWESTAIETQGEGQYANTSWKNLRQTLNTVGKFAAEVFVPSGENGAQVQNEQFWSHLKLLPKFRFP